MRTKIDYGIYFNNDFCQIARMEEGMPVIKLSETMKESMPLCVSINKRQDILVGDTAWNIIKYDQATALKTLEKGKTNTFIGFTRTLGTTHRYESSNANKDFSSDELLAECFKKLKSFAADEIVNSVVIATPDKFLNSQNKAVFRAGKLAGFKQIELVQESIAISLSYGFQNGTYIIFDFGKSEFKVSLLKNSYICDTDTDSWLGSNNLDEAIVDQIIIPNLAENFEIGIVLESPDKKELLRNAVKFYAEEAKIQLSTNESYNILSNLGDLPFKDENGDEPEIDVEITQKDMEKVVGPFFQKAIDISKELLKRNNLKGSDLGALILVGGPTYSPILRRMLKEQITDKVDTSVDPMTVVAKGAALFASTISVSDEVKEVTRDKTKLQLDIKYEATSVELDEMVNLKVLKEKTTGTFPEKIYADVVRFDGAWSSGKKLIGEKATILDVLLVEGRSNSFEINVYDEAGNKLDCQPNQFSILQGIGGLDGMQVLPYHIGIGKFFQSEDKDLFLPVKGLEKSKKIPATGVINGLKTRSTVRPGTLKDVIRIPIYQGDYNAEGTNPVLNNFITEVIITGESLPALLPEGSDVDITIKVDRSQLMKFSAYFPLLNHTEELEIEIKSTEAPDENYLSTEISNAKRAAQRVNATDVAKKLDALEAQLENEGGSADGKMKIQDGLRKELLKLDSAEKTAEWPQVEQELKDDFYELEDLIRKIKANGVDENLNIDKIERHIQEYKKKIELIIKGKDIKEAKNLISEIGQLDFELRSAVTGNAMDVQYLQQINGSFDTYKWKDRNKARQLINQGLQLAMSGNTTAIRPILVQIIDLMPDDEKRKETLR